MGMRTKSFETGEYQRLAQLLIDRGVAELDRTKGKEQLEQLLRAESAAGKGEKAAETRALLAAAIDSYDAKDEQGLRLFWPYQINDAITQALNPEPGVITPRDVPAVQRARDAAGTLASQINNTIRYQIVRGVMRAAEIESATDTTITLKGLPEQYTRLDQGALPAFCGAIDVQTSTLVDPTYRLKLSVKTHDMPRDTQMQVLGRLGGQKANPAEYVLRVLREKHGYRILGTIGTPGEKESFVMLFWHPDFEPNR